MTPLQTYFPLAVALVVAVGLAALLVGAAALLGPRRPSKVKASPFECGSEPIGTARERFGVKFYLIALLFIVFDIEAVFIYPWAVLFSDAARGHGTLSPVVLGVDMLIFVGIIVVGLAYAWRKGALEWGGRVEQPETRA